MHDTITREISRQFAGRRCWLDGKEAKVCGGENKFATVATLDGTQSIQFSWHTVNRIMRSSLEFKS